ncbi:hypothetical protein psyc5s11_38080 [Clostridium gelidum]|uniref:MFS transporter n=1 Tax=Clostridium gelidum TaxID=704125 RepID=A0ABM7T6U8_9CLOT|nr:MFS transporter [Clostridium gelidum]BCZ47741.1 hypothetical protein psyc5s11_38080 [Clostridium gelidum]
MKIKNIHKLKRIKDLQQLEILKELKNFLILWSSQSLSQFGSSMTSFSLIVWAFEKQDSVLSISMLMICSLLPSILLSFLAGTFIDKWNKKLIMIISDTIAAICSVFVLILLFNNRLEISYLYIINVILGIMNAFQSPASSVAVTMIVPKRHYIKISGLQSLSSSMVTTFTPLVATSIYAFGGTKVILFIDLSTFFVAFIALLFCVKIPDYVAYKKKQKLSTLADCLDGVSYIFNNKSILHLIIFMGFVNLIASIYNCNLTPMILARTDNNKIILGVITSFVGIGGVIGSILFTIKKTSKSKVNTIFNSITFSFLICNTLLGIGGNAYIWSFAVLAGHIAVPFLTGNVEVLMRTKVPIEIQGRVFSARNTIQYATIPIGYILGGILADKCFEPIMASNSYLKQILSMIVGSGKGSGISIIFIIIGITGFAVCCMFRRNKYIKALDD